MTFPSLRKRTPTGPPIPADLSAPHGMVGVRPGLQDGQQSSGGAIGRILTAAFGRRNNPAANLSAEVAPEPKGSFYYHFEGDLFTPGAQNWVFEPSTELPIQTLWGNAFIRVPNTFSVRQPHQIYSNPNVTTAGIGGLVAGQIAHQPLETYGA